MPTTTNLGLTYPSGAVGVPPDVPGDIYKLAKSVDDLAGSASISYAGSVQDWTTEFRTVATRSGRVVSFVLNVNPGANGLSASSANKLILALPVGFRTAAAFVMNASIYRPGIGWDGNRAILQVQLDGTLVVNYSTITVPDGALLSGSASWTAA